MKLLLGIFAWSLLCILPLLVDPNFFAGLLWQDMTFSIMFVYLALISCLLIGALEGLFLRFLCGLLRGFIERHVPNKLLSKCIGIISVSVLCVYLIFVLASWVSFYFRGAFLEPEDISLLPYIVDVKSLAYDMSLLDKILSVLLACVGAALAFAFWKFSTGFKLLSEARPVLISFAVILLLTGVIFAFVARSLDPKDWSDFKILEHYNLSPQTALIMATMDSSAKIPELSHKPTLIQYYSFDEYRQKVSSSWKSERNVIVVLVEALRQDVVDKEIQGIKLMPTLSKIAKEGYAFPLAYAQGADTSYTQAVVTTGLYPQERGARNLNLDLDYPYLRIYDALHDFGYRTAYLTREWSVVKRLTSSSKIDFLSDPAFEGPNSQISATYRGSDSNLTCQGNECLRRFDRVNLDRLKHWIAPSDTQPQKPFFVLLYLYSSHFPYEIADDGHPKFFPWEMAVPPSFFSYSPELIPIMKNRYFNTLSYVDSLLLELTDFLKAQGLYGNTTLLITGDHGELFGEHGKFAHATSLYEPEIRVPIILSNLQGFFPLGAGSLPVGHIDIAPTVLELAGLPQYEGYQGRSMLVPAAESHEPITNEKRVLFSSVRMISSEDSVVLYPYKYVQNYRGEESRFYNLEEDPDENHNLLGAEKVEAQKLKSYLDEFRAVQHYYYRQRPAERWKSFPPRIEDLQKFP